MGGVIFWSFFSLAHFSDSSPSFFLDFFFSLTLQVLRYTLIRHPSCHYFLSYFHPLVAVCISISFSSFFFFFGLGFVTLSITGTLWFTSDSTAPILLQIQVAQITTTTNNNIDNNNNNKKKKNTRPNAPTFFSSFPFSFSFSSFFGHHCSKTDPSHLVTSRTCLSSRRERRHLGITTSLATVLAPREKSARISQNKSMFERANRFSVRNSSMREG